METASAFEREIGARWWSTLVNNRSDHRHRGWETLRGSRKAEGVSVFDEPFALNPRR